MMRVDLPLEAGRVYRPRDFASFAKNPSVVLDRLVAEGELERLGHGLYHRPRRGRFGPRPPDDAGLLRAFLGGRDFAMSGPAHWNALRLGTTAVASIPLVYNAVRSGTLEVGRRTFHFRRVRFPRDPTLEWYAVDLLNHARQAGAEAVDLLAPLRSALVARALEAAAFFAALDEYGTRTTRNLVEERLRDLRP